ncbi:hypothetical protein [Pedobacter jamesrossensis]|uniref:hypothetical protein n=1 Tax=Pedobacter jamesrossensis TaxID=1908238 RepID=UPI00366B2203
MNSKELLKEFSKKHRGIKSDLSKITDDLELNPNLGVHLGQNVYKSDWPFLVLAKGNWAELE